VAHGERTQIVGQGVARARARRTGRCPLGEAATASVAASAT